MAKVIEFYARDLFPNKVKWVPRDQRGKVIEFPKEKSAVGAKTGEIQEFDELGRIPVFYPGCF